MVLENKFGTCDSMELAHVDEWISKAKARQLFETGLLGTFEVGTFSGLSKIHQFLFDEIYDSAGKMRTINLTKGGTRFVSVLYLQSALESISQMPQSNFNQIVEKYVEMNVAHPFREGNGRSTRIWLNAILQRELRQVIDWSMINKEDYLLAMERSLVRDLEIKTLLKAALTDQIRNREVYMRGIDASYSYGGYSTYNAAGFLSSNSVFQRFIEPEAQERYEMEESPTDCRASGSNLL